MKTIDALLDIMRQLRDKDRGCPWDLEQTMQSVVPHTIEEAYELAEAIEQHGKDDIKNEIGDLLFQVIFYAQMASEKGWFGFEDICLSLKEKLLTRHPHVFSSQQTSDMSADEQNKQWEKQKASHRQTNYLLENIPKTLPAMSRAQKVQKRVATVGFDWPSITDVMHKLNEEVDELKSDLHDQDKASEELGDLLFTCVNMARWLRRDPEQILRQATRKFERRFRTIEEQAHKQHKTLDHFSLDALEAMWQQTKNKS